MSTDGRRTDGGRAETLFREVNERIAESARRFGADSARFMCECGTPSCAARIEVPLPAYDRLRSDGTGADAVLAPGHYLPAM